MKRLGYGMPAAVLSVICALCAVASPVLAADTPQGNAKLEARVVKAYEPGALAPADYTVIDRLWVSRRQTAFDVRRHGDLESAQQALLAEAARVGGDGVVNMHCVQSAGVIERRSGHYCYGNVIKLK
jgi:hypothetical protein